MAVLPTDIRSRLVRTADSPPKPSARRLLTEYTKVVLAVVAILVADLSRIRRRVENAPRIKSQVMVSPNRAVIRPSKGFAPKPGRKPIHLWGDQLKDKHNSSGWVERRTDLPHHVQMNSNLWKSHAARRLLTTVGAPSSVSLRGKDESDNRLLVEHLTAEIPRPIVYFK